MNLINFENKTGKGIVSFEPWRTQGDEYNKDASRWYCHLNVNGERIFEYGCPCGTCGILFRRIGSPANQISDEEAVHLLGKLEAVPSDNVLLRLAQVLERGFYHPILIEGLVHRIEPGTQEDYFATDVVRLFGLEPPDCTEPAGPGTSYYQFGSSHELQRTGRTSGPHKALITSVLMPLHEPNKLHRERIDYWKRQFEGGMRPTAFAVSVIDNQEPALAPPDATYPFEEQFLFTNCILDGHHRIQAAAELKIPARILSFFTKEFSIVRNTDDIEQVLSRFAQTV